MRIVQRPRMGSMPDKPWLEPGQDPESDVVVSPEQFAKLFSGVTSFLATRGFDRPQSTNMAMTHSSWRPLFLLGYRKGDVAYALAGDVFEDVSGFVGTLMQATRTPPPTVRFTVLREGVPFHLRFRIADATPHQ